MSGLREKIHWLQTATLYWCIWGGGGTYCDTKLKSAKPCENDVNTNENPEFWRKSSTKSIGNKKQCPLCHELFNSQLELNWHPENDHKYTFICPKQSCGVEFSSKAALKKHAKVHLPFAFKCPTCQRGFHYKYELDNHKNTHTNFVIKCKYPCCNKVYKSEGEYRRHYKTHSDTSEYRCEICDKCFVENKNCVCITRNWTSAFLRCWNTLLRCYTTLLWSWDTVLIVRSIFRITQESHGFCGWTSWGGLEGRLSWRLGPCFCLKEQLTCNFHCHQLSS